MSGLADASGQSTKSPSDLPICYQGQIHTFLVPTTSGNWGWEMRRIGLSQSYCPVRMGSPSMPWPWPWTSRSSWQVLQGVSDAGRGAGGREGRWEDGAVGLSTGGGGVSPDGLFAQQEQEPIRGRPTVRGKRTYGGRPGQRVEEQGTWAAQKHSEAGYGRPVDRGVWTAKTVKRPRQQPAHPQYANYWAPLTRKRHILPPPAQPQHTNYWAPRKRKRHQQEHRPQRPTESSDPTQHAKGRTGDCPGSGKETTTRRNVTWGVNKAPQNWGWGVWEKGSIDRTINQSL